MIDPMNPLKMQQKTTWDDYDKFTASLKGKRTEKLGEVHKLAEQYHSCFKGQYGREVLKHLESMTLKQPCWDPRFNESHAYAREGQNSLVKYIKEMIQLYEQNTNKGVT